MTVNTVATNAFNEKNTSFNRTGFKPVGYLKKYSFYRVTNRK